MPVDSPSTSSVHAAVVGCGAGAAAAVAGWMTLRAPRMKIPAVNVATAMTRTASVAAMVRARRRAIARIGGLPFGRCVVVGATSPLCAPGAHYAMRGGVIRATTPTE